MLYECQEFDATTSGQKAPCSASRCICEPLQLNWVAVKGLDLSYHIMDANISNVVSGLW